MITISIPSFVFVVVLVLLVGCILGISAVFDKLHRRFEIPWYEEIWDNLTIRSRIQHKPYKLIIAGNYGQFHNWVQQYVIHPYHEERLVGLPRDKVEFIKVGSWQNSPVVDVLPEYVEDWEKFLNDPVY